MKFAQRRASTIHPNKRKKGEEDSLSSVLLQGEGRAVLYLKKGDKKKEDLKVQPVYVTGRREKKKREHVARALRGPSAGGKKKKKYTTGTLSS